MVPSFSRFDSSGVFLLRVYKGIFCPEKVQDVYEFRNGNVTAA